MVRCPGCGAPFEPAGLPGAPRARASGECLDAYHALTARTLALGDPGFVHQHAVDAWTAQHVGDSTPLVGTFFALAGLYLALERGLDGRQVQQAHVAMTHGVKAWPAFRPPSPPGTVTVLLPLSGGDLTEALRIWMADVWDVWAHEHDRVRVLTDARLDGG